MKFLKKINRQYLTILSSLLILISLGGYFLLRFIIDQDIKEDIAQKEVAIIRELKTQAKLMEVYPFFETKKIALQKVEPRGYKHIYLMDEAEDETEPYLEYTHSVEIDGQWYLIKIRHSMMETDELIAAIALPLLALLVLTFVFSFLLTKKLNYSLWRTFEENLKQIESYSFSQNKNIALKNTRIEEFDRLNRTIRKMTAKLREDYSSVKAFTENASHEIQTPVSIALLHLEELLQHPLPKEDMKQVITVMNSLKRLSSLMKSLLLLTKIENRQFDADQMLILNDVFKNKAKEYQPLMEAKKLELEWEMSHDFRLQINPYIADILVGNLMLNAIKHNQQSGSIRIAMNSREIKICNSGPAHKLTNTTIFERFIKENSDSHGLGLAIVKEICEKHFLIIAYGKNNFHCFTICHKNNAHHEV